MELYSNSRSRGVVCEWFAKELDPESKRVQIRVVNMAEKEQKSSEYVKSESGAILIYLSEHVGGITGKADKAAIWMWVLFANTSLQEALLRSDARPGQLQAALSGLETSLQGKEYLQGSFSAADVAVGSALVYAKHLRGYQLDFSPYPAIQQYTGRVSQRPAFREAFAGYTNS